MKVLRSEWIKWRTVRVHWVLWGVAVAFPIVVGVLTAAFRGDAADPASLHQLVLGLSMLTGLLLGVLAAIVTGGEFGHQTIRPTFAAVPRRARVLVAKAIVAVGVGLVGQALVIAVAVPTTFAITDARGLLVESVGASGVASAYVGVLVFTGCVSLIGHALGCLMRSTALAITTIVLWPLLVEGLVGVLIGVIRDDDVAAAWLPFQAGFSLLEYSQFGNYDHGPDRLQAGLLFGGVAVLLTLVGSALTARRDA